MHAAALADLDRRIAEASDAQHDPRLTDLANVTTLLIGLDARSPASLRDGMLISLEIFLQSVLEDIGRGGTPALAFEEMVGFGSSEPADAAPFSASAARLSGILADSGLDARIARELCTCVAALSCIALHLVDSEQIHATALLERISDVERVARRAVLTASGMGPMPAIEMEVDNLAPHLQALTDRVVQSLTQPDERLAWRSWRRAGAGPGRTARAISIARQEKALRSVLTVVERIASDKGIAD